MITEKRYVRITKDPPRLEFVSSDSNDVYTFEWDALNLNSFIRPLVKNNLEWRALELRVSNELRIDNWDVRLIDLAPSLYRKDFEWYVNTIRELVNNLYKHLYDYNYEPC